MPKANREDFEDRLSRLRNAATYIDKTIEVLRVGVEIKITPPQITLRNVPNQIRNMMPTEITDSPLLSSFNQFPSTISVSEQTRIIDEAATVIEEDIYPAFARLLKFFESEYIPYANQSIALSNKPNGKRWYEYRTCLLYTSPSPRD